MKHKILIVDDEAANLRVLERLLHREHEIICAESGAEALELLRLHDVALIISDQRMPGITGIEFLKHAAEMRQHTVRLILTGYTDINALVEAINSGVVYKYVTKPWVNEDLQQTVKRALQHYETVKAQHELELQNERLHLQLRAAQEGFIKVLSEMLDFKAPDKRGHARRTKSYSVALGKAFNITTPELEHLALAAFLHEVVDFYVPNGFLSAALVLTSEGQEAMKQDFAKGLELLESFPGMTEVVSILSYYHEQWDGSGYPYNLQGEQIPLLTRIIAVADAYDEMTTRHSLKPDLSHAEALRFLKSNMGKRYDPEVVKAFYQLNSTSEPTISDVNEEDEEYCLIRQENENKLEGSQHYFPAEI
jgi:putative two-component system response regulator